MASGSPNSRHRDREVILEIPSLTLYNDGSHERRPFTQAPACSQFVHGVASKDVVLDPSTGVWARIFLPEHVAHNSIKVPLVLHFHGGGFCMGSVSAPIVHHFCARMAVRSSCVWMSVNYRLAPEHRLPAAYDDAYASLLWLLSQASAQSGASGTEPWLTQHVDFSKCFLAGESAGGTIVHFLAARAAERDTSPVSLRGLLLIHAGLVKGKSDREDAQRDARLLEFFERSALPPGSEWGHPLTNPFHADSPKLRETDLPPVFVAAAEKDALRNTEVEYYEVLKQVGTDAQLFESQGEGHCFHLSQERGSAAELLEAQMVQFIKGLL